MKLKEKNALDLLHRTQCMESQEVLPELVDPERLYPISETARNLFFKAKTYCNRNDKVLIVFYGGVRSGIPRHNTDSIRYKVGSVDYIFMVLREMKFETWMDYRAYHAIFNKEFTYCKIGKRVEIRSDKLLEIMFHKRSRDKIAEARRMRRERVLSKDDKRIAERYKKFRSAVDANVDRFIEFAEKSGVIGSK